MGRGRPKGAKNRPKEEIAAERAMKASMPKRSRGRPSGSKNKPKVAEVELTTVSEQPVKRKTGRPKGSKSSYTVSDKAVAQRYDNATAMKMSRLADSDEAKEFNAKLLTHVMKVYEISTHADKNDVNTLKSCFIAYVQLCQEDGFNISNLAAYSSMGFPSLVYFERYCQKDDPERRELREMVKSVCSMFREGLVSANKLNPVIGIFWQRNFDGLRNDTEQVQAALEQDEDYANGSNSYKEKYKNLIGE